MKRLKAFKIGPLAIVRDSTLREVEHVYRLHHDVGRVHADCGAAAMADAWGRLCPVCMAFPQAVNRANLDD